jgi:hypothetical protein
MFVGIGNLTGMKFMKDSHIFIDTKILVYAYSDTELEKKIRVVSLLEMEMIYNFQEMLQRK